MIDADLCARKVTEKGSAVLSTLAEEFGYDILADGNLDRRLLARRAFKDQKNTELLNSILLPVISDHISNLINQEEKSGCKTVVLDAPTLFEAGCDRLCDATVAVLLEKESRLERIIQRDTLSEEEALLRVSAGKDDEFYKNRVDYVLYNNTSLEELQNHAKDLYLQLTEK